MLDKEYTQGVYKDSIAYHREKPFGKLRIQPTKAMANQRDLSLAYSPGVAGPCKLIEAYPHEAAQMTARGNLVAVISNGTAVLGLGNIGALASKPVMEGKAVLFKKFADIDVFDIEVNETDIDKFVAIVASLEPTFGGINLEDIKAPECFHIERRLKQIMKIPVFHDDQHGTAIIGGAAVQNAMELTGKDISKIKIVCSGAGAAALSSLDYLVAMGAKKENIFVCDKEGLVWSGRNTGMDEFKSVYARNDFHKNHSLLEVIDNADVFLGLSAAKAMTQEMVKKMAKNPLILALANPEPEIRPELVKEVRDDALICTGRSDYPNQVNNVLCFPFLFRGALDVGATQINEAMKLAAGKAIASLAKKAVSEETLNAYGSMNMEFGVDYLIPKPLDSRLLVEVSMAVAKAAMDSGVATRPISDFNEYRHQLAQNAANTYNIMRPIYEVAQKNPQRVVFCEGESEKILQALPEILNENYAKPILIGRKQVIMDRIAKLKLHINIAKDIEITDPTDDPRYNDYTDLLHKILGRNGVSKSYARSLVRNSNTMIGCLMVRKGEADALICGSVGNYHRHLDTIKRVIGAKKDRKLHALYLLALDKDPMFFTDTHVAENPTAQEIVDMALSAVDVMKLFGVNPKVALLSHSNFGASQSESAVKMSQATHNLKLMASDFKVEGEMHADTAFNKILRDSLISDNALDSNPNLLVFPNLDSANICYNMVKVLVANGISTGPMLMGTQMPAHILTNAATIDGVINMAAFASVDAFTRRKSKIK